MNSFVRLPEVRAVIFDAVGTLISPDPPATIRYVEVGRRFGSRHEAAVIAERFRAAFHRQDAIDRQDGYRTSEEREIERWRCIVHETLDDVHDAETCFHELFEWFSRPQAWRPPPDAADVLAALAARSLVLGIASNYDRRLYKVIAGTEALRPASGLVVISAEVGWRKPAGEFFGSLCAAAGCRPQEMLYVGDDVANDYEGAAAAGISTILYDPRGRQAEPGRRRIGRLAEVHDIVRR